MGIRESVNMADRSRSSSPEYPIVKEEVPKLPTSNAFKNDGSFMEMFKRLQEQQGSKPVTVKVEEHQKIPSPPMSQAAKSDNPKKTALSFVGKRRGGRVLSTGIIKKQKKEDSDRKDGSSSAQGKTDAWSQYMNEVRRYKEQSCEEEGKRRPLVK